MRRLLTEFHLIFLKLNRNTVFAIVLVLVALLGYLDYATGFEITFSFFYLIPISISAWYIDQKIAQIITAISITTWMVSNWLAGEIYSQEIIRYWNASVRFIVFYFISYLVSEFKLVLQQERRLSRTDYLTGISNSREFYNQAELEIKRADRYKHPLSAVYIDLDFFKKVNDEKGHREGDKLLKTITQLISSNLRKTDVFARLGGDEFGLLLPNTDQRSARTVLQKVEMKVMRELKDIHSPVSLSAGVITFLSAPKTVDELIHKADALMYQAKSQGKNQVVYIEYD